jgi:two-component sensor histidine kinase/PAS domain-containing protein
MENDASVPKADPAPRSGLMRFAPPERRESWLFLPKMAVVFFGCVLIEVLSALLRYEVPEVTLPLIPIAGFAFAALLVYSETAILPIVAGVITTGALFPNQYGMLIRVPSLSFGIILGWLISRRIFAGKQLEAPLLRPNQTLFFIIGGGICGAMLSATFLQVGSLTAGTPPNAGTSWFWLHGFLAMMAGFMAFTPASYYLLRGDFSTPVKDHLPGETSLLFIALLAAVATAIWVPVHEHLRAATLITLPFPFLVWIALRRGLRATSLALALLAVTMLAYYYLWDSEPLKAPVISEGLYQLQFVFSAISCLLLASQRDAIFALTLKTKLAHEAAEFCAWEWSLRGGITFWSKGWTDRTGLVAESPMPLECWIATVHPDDQQEFAETISRGALNPTPGFTMRFRSWDVNRNDWYWTKSIGHIIKLDPNGNPLKAIGVVLDIDDIVEKEKLRVVAVQNEAELATLRAQLNPHFLFNCLNSIRALIGRDEHKARDMVTTLASLLRSLLEQRNNSFETVAAELDIIQKYLSLEQIRFGSRLRTEMAIDPLAMDCHIPSFLMLTLVENAVKHGISKAPEGGTVNVRVHLEEDRTLLIHIANTGHLNARPGHKGVGLENTRRRAHLMTNDAEAFEIYENPPGTVVATVRVPTHCPTTKDQSPINR